MEAEQSKAASLTLRGKPNCPEEKQTITKTPPPVHIKNPKRVAQGKKLAAVSRAAKLKKKQQMETTPEESPEMSSGSLITSTGTILGTCCTLLLTYIAYSNWVGAKNGWTRPGDNHLNPKEIPKAKTVYKDLSQFDL